jgi:predicted lipid carrier protein YhbT
MKIPAVSSVVKPLLSFATGNRRFDVQKTMVEKMLQGAFSGALEGGELDFFEGRCIALDIHDVNFGIAIGLQRNRFVVMPDKQAADAVIRGELPEFIGLAAGREDSDTLFAQRRLCLEGDTELGLAFKTLMDGVDLGSLPWWVQRGIKVADHFQRKA